MSLIIVVDNLIQVVEVIERCMTGQGIGGTILFIAKIVPEWNNRMRNDAAVDVLPVLVGAEAKVREAFAKFPGRWLAEDDMRRNGIWRDDRKFGDAVFLADPGVQFCPSDMGVKPLNGMHGYDPSDIDSLACWLSTEPVPDGVTRVCDYFSWISQP